MSSFERPGWFCRVDCEFGSRRLKTDSSVVVACEEWLLWVESSEITNISEAAERRRLRCSSVSEMAVVTLGWGSILRVDPPMLTDDISEISSTDCEFGCAFGNWSSTLQVSWVNNPK